VNHLAHLRGRQEHARAAVIGLEKAVAVGMALDAAGDQSDALRDQQGSGAVSAASRAFRSPAWMPRRAASSCVVSGAPTLFRASRISFR
jgi:hypothetical protein